MASTPPTEFTLDVDHGVSISQLYNELVRDRPSEDDAVTYPSQRTEELLSSVVDQLFGGIPFRFEEASVKGNLDEILVLLVALRDGETHGKGLMEDLALLFDSRLSPGTVYPRLHDLEDDGVLEMQELVRTKEYRVDDLEAAAGLVENAMHQHLALGLFYYSALHEL